MVRKYVGEVVYNSFVKPVVKAFTKPKKTTGTEVIKNVPLSPNLKTKRDIQDAAVKAIDEGAKKGLGGAKPSQNLKQIMSELKKDESKKLKDFSYTADKYQNKAKGGRVGLKRGTGLTRKSNVDKIKKTFGPKKSLGMQSVIYGLDKNPKITAADPKAKFIAAAKKKKKKVI